MAASSGAPAATRTSSTMTAPPARAARLTRSRRAVCRAPDGGAGTVVPAPPPVTAAGWVPATVTASLHRDLGDVQHTGPVADDDVPGVLAVQPLVDRVVERDGQRLLTDLLVQRAPAHRGRLEVGD